MSSPSFSKLCGRQLLENGGAGDAAWAAGLSVCTNVVPFQVGVHFDGDELTSGIDGEANSDETELRPGGTIGFSLCYTTA